MPEACKWTCPSPHLGQRKGSLPLRRRRRSSQGSGSTCAGFGPSTGVTWLQRYYEPSDSPAGRRTACRLPPLEVAILRRRGSLTLPRSPCAKLDSARHQPPGGDELGGKQLLHARPLPATVRSHAAVGDETVDMNVSPRAGLRVPPVSAVATRFGRSFRPFVSARFRFGPFPFRRTFPRPGSAKTPDDPRHGRRPPGDRTRIRQLDVGDAESTAGEASGAAGGAESGSASPGSSGDPTTGTSSGCCWAA